MLLLLLLGASSGGPPPADGVRAYGHTSYSAVTGGVQAQSSVTLVGSSVGALTNAQTTEE